MPLTPPHADALPAGTPTWIRQLLATIGTSPATTAITTAEPMVEALGKPVSELLGAVFTTPTKTGLPARVRLTNYDAGRGLLKLTGVRGDAAPFEVAPAQLDALLGAGTVGLQQPPAAGVAALRARLAALLDGAPSR